MTDITRRNPEIRRKLRRPAKLEKTCAQSDQNPHQAHLNSQDANISHAVSEESDQTAWVFVELLFYRHIFNCARELTLWLSG